MTLFHWFLVYLFVVALFIWANYCFWVMIGKDNPEMKNSGSKRVVNPKIRQ